MSCKHEWLIPSDKRTRCKRCGDDGWVSHDGRVHETYEACMKHDMMSYAARPFSVPTQKVYAKTQSGHKAETTSVTSTTMSEEVKPKCPRCGHTGLLTERRPNGDTICNACGYRQATATFGTKTSTNEFQLTTENVSEKPQTEAPETAMEFLSRLGMDAKKWTDEFLKLKPDATDFGVMIGWFSNAIMAGYDRANWANEKRIAELEAENDKLRQASEWHLGLYRQFEKTNEENERTKSQLKDFRNASGALVQALEEIAEMHTRNADLEAKLKLATDGLETLQTEADDWHLRGIARETLAKLRGEK